MTRFNDFMIHKKASLLEGVAEGGGAGIAALIPYIIGAPLAAGTAVGYMASRMSSPGDSDVKALQKRVMDTEVREKLALSKRRLEQLRKKVKADEGINIPGTTKQRDMFA